MAPIVCAECGRVIRTPREQYEERLEYRRLDARERRGFYRLRLVCIDCADDLLRRYRRRPDGDAQRSLFDVPAHVRILDGPPS